jgi:hypothetical protein
VSAELSHCRRLVGAPDARRHVSAREPRELHREVADAAGGAGDEHATAEEQAALGEGVERGEPGHGKGRRLGQRHLGGQLGERMRRHRHPLRPRALGEEPDHARPDPRARGVGGGALHLAGQIPARAPAGRGHARAPHLAAVERDRPHAHDGFTAIGGGVGNRTDDEPARRFEIDDDGTIAHSAPPLGFPACRGWRREYVSTGRVTAPGPAVNAAGQFTRRAS